MQQSCNRPLTCLTHGLAWPCELCSLENKSSTACQHCGLAVLADPSSGGQRVCAGWLQSAPAYPVATPDRGAQAPMDPLAARHPGDTWLRRLQRLGLEVDRAQGTISLARPDDVSDAGARAVSLTFSDRTSAVLCRPSEAEFAKHYDSYDFKTWTPEIRFDDEVLFWKELESVEQRTNRR